MKALVGLLCDCGNIADGSFAALVVTPGVTLSDSSWVSTPSTAQDRKLQRCCWSWTIFSLSFQSNARSSFFGNVSLENHVLVMIYSLNSKFSITIKLLKMQPVDDITGLVLRGCGGHGSLGWWLLTRSRYLHHHTIMNTSVTWVREPVLAALISWYWEIRRHISVLCYSSADGQM